MNETQKEIARHCLAASEAGTRTFPEIVGMLTAAGFESYQIDFRRAEATYYLPEGDSLQLPTHRGAVAIGADFDKAALQAAIREAQQMVPGYSYMGFCRKAMQAGCVGYTVSFKGRRAVYVGRDAETHVEHFPR